MSSSRPQRNTPKRGGAALNDSPSSSPSFDKNKKNSFSPEKVIMNKGKNYKHFGWIYRVWFAFLVAGSTSSPRKVPVREAEQEIAIIETAAGHGGQALIVDLDLAKLSEILKLLQIPLVLDHVSVGGIQVDLQVNNHIPFWKILVVLSPLASSTSASLARSPRALPIDDKVSWKILVGMEFKIGNARLGHESASGRATSPEHRIASSDSIQSNPIDLV